MKCLIFLLIISSSLSLLTENKPYFDSNLKKAENIKDFENFEKNEPNPYFAPLSIRAKEDRNFEEIQVIQPKLFSPILMKRNKYRRKNSTIKMSEALINETCIKKGGGLVNGECYKYFPTSKNFDAARAICQGTGGDLWIPDFNDHMIVVKLLDTVIKHNIVSRKDFYIGAKVANGEKLYDIKGNDITNTYFSIVRDTSFDPAIGYCAYLSFINGALASRLSFTECDSVVPFICEYPIKVDSSM